MDRLCIDVTDLDPVQRARLYRAIAFAEWQIRNGADVVSSALWPADAPSARLAESLAQTIQDVMPSLRADPLPLEWTGDCTIK